MCTKLRLFQYKVTRQKVLITNIKLKYYGLREDMKCYYCNDGIETIFHLFWSCPIVKLFWLQVARYLANVINEYRFELSAYAVIFNVIVRNPYDYLNTVCIIVKHYIYATRCTSEEHWHIVDLCQRIFRYIKIEEFIAIKNNKMDKHMLKWQKFIEVMNA